MSILRLFKPGALGSAPLPIGGRLSPAYDLVNTASVFRGDLFALPVNGRENNLRRRDFLILAERGGYSTQAAGQRMDELAAGIRTHLEPVLSASGLSDERAGEYRRVVEARLTQFA